MAWHVIELRHAISDGFKKIVTVFSDGFQIVMVFSDGFANRVTIICH